MNFYKKHRTHLIQLLLFVVTVITTTLSGYEWLSGKMIYGSEVSWSEIFLIGMYFSIPFLGILTVHEFGHYIAARLYKIKVTLPYYIPIYIPFFINIGTMGALIRLKGAVQSRTQFFDIGVAGPLAGFVVAIAVLFYGFTHLPPVESIYEIHPEYEEFGKYYAEYVYEEDYMRTRDSLAVMLYQTNDSIAFTKDKKNKQKKWSREAYNAEERELSIFSIGTNLTFMFFEEYVVEDKSLIPNKYEIMHNPWIFAGFLALFFTAMNLLPIGQLDGGHILYGLIGYEKSKKTSEYFLYAFILYAGIGLVPFGMPFSKLVLHLPLYLLFLLIVFQKIERSPTEKMLIAVILVSIQYLVSYLFPALQGYNQWLLFVFIIGRFLGVYHPRALDDSPLDARRKIIGWIALIVFVISFSPQPFVSVAIL